MKRKHTMPWLAAAALALTLPLAAVAADATPVTPETPEATAPVGDGEAIAGLKVGKDPRSGKLRATTAAEDAELARQMREYWAQFPRHEAKTDRRTGLTSLVVVPHAMTTTMIAIDADGRPAWDCVADHDHAADKLQELRQRTSREDR